MQKPLLVCFDRDGTLITDNDNYPGSRPSWKDEIDIMPGAFHALKSLNALSEAYIFTISNQAGVALRGNDAERGIDFDHLTEDVMNDVDREVRARFGFAGCIIRGGFCCPYVGNEYASKARRKGREVDTRYVMDNHPDTKPNIGMLEKAAGIIKKGLADCSVWMIGDRLTDVQTGLNAGGRGILVPGEKTRQLGDIEKVYSMPESEKSRVYVARDIVDAAEHVIRNYSEVP